MCDVYATAVGDTAKAYCYFLKNYLYFLIYFIYVLLKSILFY